MISSKWPIVLVSDIAAESKNSLVGGPFGSDLVSRDYVPEGVPVIRGQNMSGDRWVGGDFVYVSEEKASALSANCAKAGDIIFTQRGTLGQVALVRDGCAPRFLISQSQMKLTVDLEVADPLFMYYQFTTEEQQDYIHAHSIQTGVPHTNLSILRKTPVVCPPLPVQKRVAAVLAALDDKIELNRRMNETLEGMARALFRSWFVDFDPVRAKAEGRPTGLPPDLDALFPSTFTDSPLGPIPEGWRVVPVADLCRVNSTSLTAKDDLAELEYIEISAVNRGDILETAWYSRKEAPGRARRRLQHGDTVLSTVRPDRGAYFLAHGPHSKLIASTGFAVFRPRSAPWSFIHCALTLEEVSDYLGRQADGGAYPAVSAEAIGRWEVVVPPEQVILAEFHYAVSSLLDQSASNRRESAHLARTRDELLPKLLCGELEVSSSTQPPNICLPSIIEANNRGDSSNGKDN